MKRIRINATFSTSITISISEPGDNATVMPNVVGLDQEAAVEQLTSLGLVPHVEEIELPNGGTAVGTVITQRPRANEDLAAGTHVFIQVRGEAPTERSPESDASA